MKHIDRRRRMQLVQVVLPAMLAMVCCAMPLRAETPAAFIRRFYAEYRHGLPEGDMLDRREWIDANLGALITCAC